MDAALLLLTACLTAQSEPKPPDPDAVLDVSKVDRAPASRDDALEAMRPELEALTGQPAQAGTDLELPAGDSVLLPVEVPLSRPSSGPLVLRIVGSRGGRFEFGPLLSTVELGTTSEASGAAAPTSKRKRHRRSTKATETIVARGRYLVRSTDMKPGLVRESANADVVELNSGVLVGRTRIELSARILEPSTELSAIEKLEVAARHFSAQRLEAETSLRKTTGSSAPLSPEALKPGRVGAEALQLIARALEHAFRAEVALTRLRFAAATKNDAAVEAAMLALGRLLPTAEVGRAQSQGKPRDELNAAAEHLRVLALDRAEVIVAGLRRRGELSRAELSELLALDGAIAAVRGQSGAAEKSMGRALCLDPKRSSPDPRPPIRTRFEAVKSAARCVSALHLDAPEAYITTVNGQSELHVRVGAGPDPYGVVAGGSIMLYGGGGGIIAERNVRAEGETDRVLLAVFPDDESYRNIEGVLLVQASAKDVSGVILASVGDPVPMRLEVGEHEDYSTGVPWWVWVGGGLLVLAGAGVATAMLVPREDVRGIGPIDVSF